MIWNLSVSEPVWARRRTVGSLCRFWRHSRSEKLVNSSSLCSTSPGHGGKKTYPLLVKLANAVSVLLTFAEDVGDDLWTRLENATTVHQDAFATKGFLDISSRRTRRKASHFHNMWASKAFDSQASGWWALLTSSSSCCGAGELRASLAYEVIVVVLSTGDNVDLGFGGVRLR